MNNSFVSGLASLLFSFLPLKNGDLKEITKPYTGEYECKLAQIGNTDLMDSFKKILLTLSPDGSFALDATDKCNKRRTEQGKYEYDLQNHEITFLWQNGAYHRSFPVQNGEIFITVPLGAKTLRVVIEHK